MFKDTLWDRTYYYLFHGVFLIDTGPKSFICYNVGLIGISYF